MARKLEVFQLDTSSPMKYVVALETKNAEEFEVIKSSLFWEDTVLLLIDDERDADCRIVSAVAIRVPNALTRFMVFVMLTSATEIRL